jgi:hypothetical protein
MPIRLYGKVRKTTRRGHPNPFHTDWRPDDDWTMVNITTQSSKWGRALSPMFVGPVDIPGPAPRVEAVSVEAAWQFSKVYCEVVNSQGVVERHLDEKRLVPTGAWRTFARRGWTEQRFSVGHGEFKKHKGVLRHPVARLKAKAERAPTFVWWEGRPISYIEGRKAAYGKLYTDEIVRSEAFRRLKAMHSRGEQIALYDFDGTDHIGLGRTYEDLLNDPGRPFGHGLLLCMLLEGVKLSSLRIRKENTFTYQRDHGLLKFCKGKSELPLRPPAA